MKTFLLIIVLTLTVLILHAGDVEEIYGTWINHEYDKSGRSHAKLIYSYDGTWSMFLTEHSEFPSETATFIIEDKWIDSNGNIWYKVSYKAYGYYPAYSLIKLSNDAKTMERELSIEFFPETLDTKHDRYTIHYRQ